MSEEPILDRMAELRRLRAVTEKFIAEIRAAPDADPDKLEAARAMLERIKGALNES